MKKDMELEKVRLGMRYNLPDRVYNDIVRTAEKNNVKKLILFGSRARGTHYDRSDIDLAVYGGDYDDFYLEITENAHTLLSFDIVEVDKGISRELQSELEKDGVIIYEKN